MTDPAQMVTMFVGARLLAGDTIPEIVAQLDEQLAALRREYAVASVSTLTSPHYSMLKAAADVLRIRC